MKNTIKAYLINPDENTHGPIEIVDDLDSLYATLNCTCIDIPVRSIAGIPFDVVCDDEGLLKAEPFISAIRNEITCEPMLVGRLLLCHSDADGNLASLSEEDISLISRHVRQIRSRLHLSPYPCLVGLDY